MEEEVSCNICFDQSDPLLLLQFDCKACVWCEECTLEWLAKQPKKGQLLKANFSCCNCRTWIRDNNGKLPREEVDKIQRIFKDLSGLLIDHRGEQDILSKQNVSSDFLDTYDFVLCNECERPFFGGLHACNEAKYNENIKHTRLCSECLPPDVRSSCEKHGPHFVAHKCHYCCSIAKSFQNGLQLCEGCSYAGDKATVKDCRSLTEQLHPKWQCDGRHPPNGQFACYGCLLCTRKCSSTPRLDYENGVKL